MTVFDRMPRATALGLAALLTCAGLPAAADTIPLATPPGITLQAAQGGGGGMGGYGAASPTVYANAEGRTFYVLDNESAADAEGASWIPARADGKAKADGDWTLVSLKDRGRQWAFKGKRLYTFKGDADRGQIKGNGADGIGHMAVFQPVPEIALPDGVVIQDLPRAGGVALAGVTGVPFYILDRKLDLATAKCGVALCRNYWRPLAAAALARPVGDFTVVDPGDGTRQWAYKGKRLFSFLNDVLPGDANGVGFDDRWLPALVVRAFLPTGIAIHHTLSGDVLATTDGMTLYTRDRTKFHQGRNLHTGNPGSPGTGRFIGANGCDDAACLAVWKPVRAPDTAQPTGFWDVLVRGDGVRQWTYQGYALYRFTGDTRPGELNGNEIHELFRGNEIYTALNVDPSKSAPSPLRGTDGLYFRAVIP